MLRWFRLTLNQFAQAALFLSYFLSDALTAMSLSSLTPQKEQNQKAGMAEAPQQKPNSSLLGPPLSPARARLAVWQLP